MKVTSPKKIHRQCRDKYLGRAHYQICRWLFTCRITDYSIPKSLEVAEIGVLWRDGWPQRAFRAHRHRLGLPSGEEHGQV